MKSNITFNNLNLLPIFFEIWRERSLTLAAKSLAMSQPVLSQALKKLREEFNDPLFVRVSHGLVPTPRADQIGEALRDLLPLIEGVYTHQTESFKNERRDVTIGATAYFELLIIKKLSAKLFAEAPNYKLKTQELTGGLPVAGLESGQIDVAIAAYFNDLPASLRLRTLADDPIVVLTDGEHPYVKMPDLKTYLAHSHISIAVPLDQMQTIDVALAEKNKSRNIVAYLNNFLTPVTLLPGSRHIVTCPKSLAQYYAEIFELEISAPPIKVKPIRPKMIWHERFHKDPAHVWLRELIVSSSL